MLQWLIEFTQPKKDEACLRLVSKQQAMVQNMMSNPKLFFKIQCKNL